MTKEFREITIQCAESPEDVFLMRWEPGCTDDLVMGIGNNYASVTLDMESAVALRDEINKMIDSHNE